ncbi:MAG TPA: hypothetical protein VFL82_06745 [Thermomicrobiales bacterium]|nr:hypothetical protein [Thermomicrobiales bacterium]
MFAIDQGACHVPLQTVRGSPINSATTINRLDQGWPKHAGNDHFESGTEDDDHLISQLGQLGQLGQLDERGKVGQVDMKRIKDRE